MIRRGFVLPSGAEFTSELLTMRDLAIQAINSSPELIRKLQSTIQWDPIKFLITTAKAVMIENNTVTMAKDFLDQSKETKSILLPYLNENYQVKTIAH